MKGKNLSATPRKSSRNASSTLDACFKQHDGSELAVINAAVSDLKRVDGVELARMMLRGEDVIMPRRKKVA